MTLQIDDVKWANDPSSLKLDATSNQRIRGWDTNDGTAEGRPDRPTLQHTNGWKYAVYKWLQYISSIRNPLGTIIRSDLTEDQFYQERDENQWVLMDGRSIAGSALSAITGELNIPDARGNVLIMGGENSDPSVETLLYPGQTVEDNASLDSVTLTAPVGDEAYELGRSIVDISGVNFTGTTNTAFARDYIYSGFRNIQDLQKRQLNNGMYHNTGPTYRLLLGDTNDPNNDDTRPVNFSGNVSHSHSFTGKYVNSTMSSPTLTVTTDTNVKEVYNNRRDFQLNKFNPKVRCCNYFIRIN